MGRTIKASSNLWSARVGGCALTVGWLVRASETHLRDLTAALTAAHAHEVALALKQERQARKMEAVGQFTGGIAHDFNNLLTMILGNTELLEMGNQTYDAEATALIAAIRLAGQRAVLLTQRLAAFSQKQAMTPEVDDH